MLDWFRTRRRKKLRASPWPEDWTGFLRQNVPVSQRLNQSQTKRLRERMRVIIAEKYWEGCDGLTITDEIKVTVAANAALLLLGSDGFYFDNVKTILMFPQAFHRLHDDGLNSVDEHRSGEAWQSGQIVLSWHDTLRGGRNENDGRNVVIHEFAHALDGLDGEMGGNLMFRDSSDEVAWKQIVDREFTSLSQAQQLGRRTLLDHYGAKNKAEFFAVASETFFEQPKSLRSQHPELSRLLEIYFQIDPADWRK